MDPRCSHKVQSFHCRKNTDCSTCNAQWPNCGWCGSSGSCLAASQELQTKMAYLNDNNINNLHVFYNAQEYRRSYGSTSRLHSSESVAGNECLLWIINGSSCPWVQNYCSRAGGSCNSCLQKTAGGCGWCEGSNECQPGTRSGDLTTSTLTGSCKENGGTWIFPNWARYNSHGQWEDSCRLHGATGATSPSPSEEAVSKSQGRNNKNDYYVQDPAQHPDFTNYHNGILIGIVALFMLLAVTVFIVLRYRSQHRSVAITGQATLAATIALEELADRRRSSEGGVDMKALELSRPSCRPKVIGQRRINNVAEETISEEVEIELASDISGESMCPCSVCLSALEEGEEARSLPCGHTFHRECIDSWLQKSKQCPVCRQVVTAAPIAPTVICAPLAMHVNASVATASVARQGAVQPVPWVAVRPIERTVVQPVDLEGGQTAQQPGGSTA